MVSDDTVCRIDLDPAGYRQTDVQLRMCRAATGKGLSRKEMSCKRHDASLIWAGEGAVVALR